MNGEIDLGGGRVTEGVVRSGDTVRRSAGAWTPTVHAYLQHLERRGFDGAPRVLGVDAEGREILTFIEGEVPSSSSWERGHATRLPELALSDDALIAVARLIRTLHEAAADFRPRDPVWREHAYPLVAREVVCHGDLGPHNTVYRHGAPVAFIDWDGARPNEPPLEFGHAAWWYVPLAADEYCAEMGFANPPDRGKRLRLFAGAYGVDPAEAIDLVREAKQREAERPRYWPDMTAAAAAEFLGHIVLELDWLAANEVELRHALTRSA
ncbi:MAG: phosphotransferase [Actinobacteria bacterium]|nr:phosphotransferase [Actinomycetota bacterium]